MEPTEIKEANSFARSFIETTGKKMILYESQWEWFERSGLDMSLFELCGPIPPSQSQGGVSE